MTTTTPTRLTWAGTLRNFAVGISQIFLQETWIGGLLILIGIGCYSVPMAITTAVGTLVATASARLVTLSTDHGLMGYCGALVGCASWATFGHGWHGLGAALLATWVGAMACPAITKAGSWIFERIPTVGGPLPVLTAPFCVASGIIALLAKAVAPAGPPPAPATSTLAPVWQFGQALLTNVGQVVLAQSWIAGAFILAGLFVAGWRVGVAAIVGSLVGTLTALVAGTSLVNLTEGLNGFNPVLVVIAVAVVFLRPGWLSWLIGVVGAIASVAVRWLITLTPVPGYTWPFIITTWVIMVVCGRIRKAA